LSSFITTWIEVLPDAFALDLFRFGVYTFPPEAAGALSIHDPLEGTETKLLHDSLLVTIQNGQSSCLLLLKRSIHKNGLF
jgi:hypothetical protein